MSESQGMILMMRYCKLSAYQTWYLLQKVWIPCDSQDFEEVVT